MMVPNPSPLRYPGGKYKTSKFIKSIIQLNKSSTYIEPFAGGSAVALDLLINKIVKKIIINDFDKSIYAFWYCVINHPEELIELINCTPITIENWNLQKEVQKDKKNQDLLSLGFSTLFLNRTNRSGILKAGIMGGKKQDGPYKLDCRFDKERIIQKIRTISQYNEKIKLYNLDATEFIDIVIKNTRNSFTFFDPPYFEKGPTLYTSFYNQEDHYHLSRKIKEELKNRKWIVTYDKSKKIKELYKGLNHIEYYLNYTAQNRRKGIEYMFFSDKTIHINPENYLNLH